MLKMGKVGSLVSSSHPLPQVIHQGNLFFHSKEVPRIFRNISFRSSVGSSCWSRSEDESGSSPESSGHRSQRSATLSPEPRSFAHRPPPPILGNGILFRESQSPNDELQYDNEL